jgi:hypothetical protein
MAGNIPNQRAFNFNGFPGAATVIIFSEIDAN